MEIAINQTTMGKFPLLPPEAENIFYFLQWYIKDISVTDVFFETSGTNFVRLT